MKKRSPVNQVVLFLSIAALYVTVGRLGMQLAFGGIGATAMFAPAGLSVAAVLLLGPRIWPVLWCSELALNFWTFRDLPVSSITLVSGVTLMSTGAVAQGYCAGMLMRKYVGAERILDDSSGVLNFVCFVIVSCFISATVGTPQLLLLKVATWPDAAQTWFTWWIGDILGIMVMTPLLWSWWVYGKLRMSWPKLREALALTVLIVAVMVVAFAPFSALAQAHYPVEYFIIPLLIWSASSFDLRFNSAVVLLIDIAAILATINGYGAFADVEVNESLLLLQLYIGCVTTLTLALTVLKTENLRIQNALRELKVPALVSRSPNV